jgi:hypothetical protein
VRVRWSARALRPPASTPIPARPTPRHQRRPRRCPLASTVPAVHHPAAEARARPSRPPPLPPSTRAPVVEAARSETCSGPTNRRPGRPAARILGSRLGHVWKWATAALSRSAVAASATAVGAGVLTDRSRPSSFIGPVSTTGPPVASRCSPSRSTFFPPTWPRRAGPSRRRSRPESG